MSSHVKIYESLDVGLLIFFYKVVNSEWWWDAPDKEILGSMRRMYCIVTSYLKWRQSFHGYNQTSL
jgi:hypothetical protein